MILAAPARYCRDNTVVIDALDEPALRFGAAAAPRVLAHRWVPTGEASGTLFVEAALTPTDGALRAHEVPGKVQLEALPLDGVHTHLSVEDQRGQWHHLPATTSSGIADQRAVFSTALPAPPARTVVSAWLTWTGQLRTERAGVALGGTPEALRDAIDTRWAALPRPGEPLAAALARLVELLVADKLLVMRYGGSLQIADLESIQQLVRAALIERLAEAMFAEPQLAGPATAAALRPAEDRAFDAVPFLWTAGDTVPMRWLCHTEQRHAAVAAAAAPTQAPAPRALTLRVVDPALWDALFYVKLAADPEPLDKVQRSGRPPAVEATVTAADGARALGAALPAAVHLRLRGGHRRLGEIPMPPARIDGDELLIEVSQLVPLELRLTLEGPQAQRVSVVDPHVAQAAPAQSVEVRPGQPAALSLQVWAGPDGPRSVRLHATSPPRDIDVPIPDTASPLSVVLTHNPREHHDATASQP